MSECSSFESLVAAFIPLLIVILVIRISVSLDSCRSQNGLHWYVQTCRLNLNASRDLAGNRIDIGAAEVFLLLDHDCL